jgi:hypothetical protein
MKTLGQRDFSAQETMHHLMSLKLVSSSFNVMPISLNSSRKIKNNPKNGDDVTHDSLLDIPTLNVQNILKPFLIFST